MALWPFGKKNTESTAGADATEPQDASVQPDEVDTEFESDTADQSQAEAAAGDAGAELGGAPLLEDYDPVNGSTGPFDGDSVEIEDFDFTDFSEVTLNLGSMQVPLPKGSQVQVEMGDQGPKMIHIVTQYGRLTPVAFAAPNKGGLWEESIEEIADGMRSEGMPVSFEMGPWGREVVGTGTNGAIRIIGVDGPRWLYRVTAAAPAGREEGMKELARETVARSFVYRGQEAILAGNSLPVTLPTQLAQQVQQAVQARAAQQDGAEGQAPAGGNPNALQDALRQIMEYNNPQNPNRQ